MIVKSSISQTTELTLQAAWYYNIEQSRGIEKRKKSFDYRHHRHYYYNGIMRYPLITT